jgi:hypothetical protein
LVAEIFDQGFGFLGIIVFLHLTQGLFESVRDSFANIGIRMSQVIVDARLKNSNSLKQPIILWVAIIRAALCKPIENGLLWKLVLILA